MKGWCYIADGASLTLAPGTIIKGDKETKAALIVEPGGQLWAKGTQSEPIVFTPQMRATVGRAIGAVSFSAVAV